MVTKGIKMIKKLLKPVSEELPFDRPNSFIK